MDRKTYISSLFTGADQRRNFQTLDTVFPVARMSASPAPFAFPRGPALVLPAIYTHDGVDHSVDSMLDETETMALLVVRDGSIVFERYADWGGPDRRWKSMSVAKSVISAALGIAWGEGLLPSLDTSVSSILPELAGSAYDGVGIKHVLQMSSGAAWNEDYSDPESDINRFAAITANGGSFNAFAATLTRAREPGTFNLYNSTDTQVLGMLLTRVTGRPIHDYVGEKLWHPLGMEAEGFWLLDDHGMEMAYAGLNATARDYARIGELFRNRGQWHGRQIVPAAWVKASVTPDAPHLMPGESGLSDSLFGYGYQWWVPAGDDGEFAAIGVYNQFIYVNPARRVVIVKLSASRRYGLTSDETSYREYETVDMLRAIAVAA
ncbi:serine hydrolase domain-containing protein [Mesorhizobium sp.]|uniref:serine hydrolase domain-containing protein n=1 Tax=Mesorhizobium sp. TaxID=1871066 RepID=UPI003BAB281C